MTDYAEKYEPKTLKDMIIHDPNHVIMPILQKYASGKLDENCIFFGGAGAGKSTLAKVLTADFYRSKGVNDITNFVHMSIAENAAAYSTPFNNGTFFNGHVWWYILDDLDKCNHKNIMNVLHHTLNSRRGYKYIITVNSIAGFPDTILSRATPFEIVSPTPEEFFPRAKQIVQLENIVASDEKIMQMLKAGERNLRGYYRAIKYL